MVKRNFLLLSLLTLLTLSFTSIDKVFAQDMPGVSVWTNKKSYSPGESGVLFIKFKTGAKVKIPKEPEIQVNLTNSDVQGAGLQIPGGGGEYLPSGQIKYTFTVPSNASGNVTIAGNVKFGYCNSDNGVCKMGNKNFSITRTVK
jgi:hypothetical protein